MERQLPAGLGEGQIAEFIEDDEVEVGEVIGNPALAASAAFSLELVDEIDGGEEASARSGADAASCDGDGQMRLARSGSTFDPHRPRLDSQIFQRGRGARKRERQDRLFRRRALRRR
jgi:hypothetical protein